jgi:hypothetical protein
MVFEQRILNFQAHRRTPTLLLTHPVVELFDERDLVRVFIFLHGDDASLE